jgi:HSP20 family protein
LAIHQRLDRLTPSQSGWAPSVDLYETPDEYVVAAELPGLSRGEIRIDHQDGRLTLSGTRPELGHCENYHRIERGHGPFSRSFQLPLPVDTDRITADLRDGVLTIRCPKSADTGVRRIRIS